MPNKPRYEKRDSLRRGAPVSLKSSLLTFAVIYKVVLLFNKTSVVCLYYRIFAITTKSFRIACHVMSKCLDRECVGAAC